MKISKSWVANSIKNVHHKQSITFPDPVSEEDARQSFLQYFNDGFIIEPFDLRQVEIEQAQAAISHWQNRLNGLEAAE